MRLKNIYENKRERSGNIPGKGEQGNVLKIPVKADFFDTHDHYTGYRSYYQYASANTCTICKKDPETSVDNEGL